MSTETTPDPQIARWIAENPHKLGPAEAWALPGCVSVWIIIRQLELEGWNAECVAEEYELPLAAVEAAIAYYRRHQRAVDERIARNRAFFAAL